MEWQEKNGSFLFSEKKGGFMGFTKTCRAFGGAGPHITRGERKSLSSKMVSVAQLEERSPVKGVVAGSSPVGNPMSYKKKKIKESKLNQLRYWLGLVIIALFKKAKTLFSKEGRMRLPQTQKVMQSLRVLAKGIRKNNKRIDEWVDNYVDQCITQGKSIELITQWCLSKDLEVRYQKQGNRFLPTKAERELVEKEIPRIISVFKENAVSVSWWITFNRSYLDSGRMNQDIEIAYTKMICNLFEGAAIIGSITIADWEDDILGSRSWPSEAVLSDVQRFVGKSAFTIELDRHSNWARKEAGLIQTDAELKSDVIFQIACEAEEGRLLTKEESFFLGGNFILVPLEVPERYVFFKILAPDFQKRIAPVLKPYPWRTE